MVDGMNLTQCLHCGRHFMGGDYVEPFCSETCAEEWEIERQREEDGVIQVECTCVNCRGLKTIGKGFTVTISKEKERDYKSGLFKPVCNECFCK